MFNLYYKIWVDCIKKASKNKAYEKNWKFRSMVLMTIAMSANLILIMTILELNVFKDYFYKIKIDFLPTRLNNAFGYMLLFILPCAILNYLLIFRKNRYKELIKKYPSYNGKLFIMYIIISLWVPFLLVIILY